MSGGHTGPHSGRGGRPSRAARAPTSRRPTRPPGRQSTRRHHPPAPPSRHHASAAELLAAVLAKRVPPGPTSAAPHQLPRRASEPACKTSRAPPPRAALAHHEANRRAPDRLPRRRRLHGLPSSTPSHSPTPSSAPTVLAIGAKAYSRIVDRQDRGTAVLFGDGAGAALLSRADTDTPGALLATDLGSDGTGARLITVAAGGSRLPHTPQLPRTARHFRMQGRTVFAHADRRMTDSSRTVLNRTGWTPDHLATSVGHQANQRILNEVAARLGIPAERCHGNIHDVGNTAAARIFLALVGHRHRPTRVSRLGCGCHSGVLGGSEAERPTGSVALGDQ
ncbi:3-oxoacyl-[acyl-carrier-protein] synthase III C-terminal domain-containing protein [Streptomyces sp. NPDC056656]|uniref:3-oxoacyl-[acyl-carrier-protein] synthase III C-terminal domain-containing protein n=1 Tax=Streptomyces sp. NPDC056656 TaxID=3345895 RepID=UPI0036C021BF